MDDFSLKYNLLHIRIATHACFLGQFDWEIFCQPLIFRYCLSLKLRFVSCMQHKDVFFLLIHSANLCLFICELQPLIFGYISDHWLFIVVCFGNGCGG